MGSSYSVQFMSSLELAAICSTTVVVVFSALMVLICARKEPEQLGTDIPSSQACAIEERDGMVSTLLESLSLYHTALSGDVAALKELHVLGALDCIPDVNARYHYSLFNQEVSLCSALMIATCENHVAVVRLLLQHSRIDVNLTDSKFCSTALGWASLKNRIECVHLLLSHPDVDVNHRAKAGWTALLAASECGHTPIACLLLRFPGIDVNLRDADGCSALMWAVLTNNEDLVEAILQSPTVDLHLRDKFGRTALSIAQEKRLDKVVQVLQVADRHHH